MRFVPWVLALSTLSALPALAEPGVVAPEGPHFMLSGARDGPGLGLVDTRTRFSVAGVITRVQLTQVYENRGAEPLEALYVFPLSTGAAVHGMRMRIGDRVLEAKIAEKQEAKRRYRRAKRNGKQAGLLEQHRPNVVQMHVANIRPGDRIEVEVDYTELMTPTDGIYELVIPAVVGPRYTQESSSHEAWTSNPYASNVRPSGPKWHMSGKLRAGLEIAALSSPSHTISPRFIDRQGVSVQVNEDKGDRDFILKYRLGGAQIETGLLLYPGDEEKFFLLTVAPPKRVAAAQVVPREYVFIVDVSGSMGGFPIETARKLMRDLVNKLRPEDRFNVVLFAGDSTVLSPESIAATPQALQRAETLVGGMRGGGGTNLLAALQRSLKLPRSENLATSFVLITDGYVSVEREALHLMANHLGTANFFTFGIGKSVNRHLIETLARAGMGSPFVVLNAQQAPDAAERFVRYVEQPVLTDIKVSFDGFDVAQVEPKNAPDLFASRPVTIFGRYHGQPSGTITVQGRAGRQSFVHTVPVGAEAASDDLGALAHLWARHRVRRLSDLDASGGAPQHAAQITSLGLKYGLLTAFTSFVAVGDEVVLHGGEGARTQAESSGILGALKGSAGGAALGVGGLGTRGSGAGGGAMGYGRGKGALGLASNSVPKVVSGQPVIMGSISRASIQRVIKRERRAMQALYEAALKRSPKLRGKIVLKLHINADGRVTKASVSEDGIGDPRLAAGLIRLARRLRFPKPPGGGSVVINYPVVFRPNVR